MAHFQNATRELIGSHQDCIFVGSGQASAMAGMEDAALPSKEAMV